MKKTFLALALTAAMMPLTFAQTSNPPQTAPSNQPQAGAKVKRHRKHRKHNKKNKTEGTTTNPNTPAPAKK